MPSCVKNIRLDSREHFLPTAVSPRLPQISPYGFILDEVRETDFFSGCEKCKCTAAVSKAQTCFHSLLVQQWLLIPLSRMISNRKGLNKC